MIQFLKMSVNKISSKSITTLIEYIEEEEYDTDSLKMDLNYNQHDLGKTNGNIANKIVDDHMMHKMMDFIMTNESMSLYAMFLH